MSCGCKTSGDSAHNCGTKSASGCDSVDTCGNSYKLSVFDWLSNVSNPTTNKCDLVEVRFKNDRKCFFKNDNNLPLHIGSVVTVESNPGHDIGVVSLTGELVKIQIKKKNYHKDDILKIYRLANQRDIETWQQVQAKEETIKKEARKIASNLRLQMKISDVEFQGDGAKVTFYYTAENRIDFRQLIKEFASTFRARIDMKQIGFRQEAAKLGGIGSCGRELCCSTWLTDFRSVNTNAARYQQLSINPQKLAGQCGKLKCCLNYELDTYMDALQDFPPSSTQLQTEKGKAFCIKIDVFRKKMWFAYAESSHTWYDLDVTEVKNMIILNKKGEKATALEDYMVVETAPKAVDIIGENTLDRFEKKAPPKNRNNKNQKNTGFKNSPAPNRSPEMATAKAEVRTSENSKPTEKKKFKKKFPPKNNKNE